MLGAGIGGIISVPTSSLAIRTPNIKAPMDFTKDLKYIFHNLEHLLRMFKDFLPFKLVVVDVFKE